MTSAGSSFGVHVTLTHRASTQGNQGGLSVKEHTTDTSAVGEPLAVSNFITGPLLSPGGWPGKLTRGECMGCTPASHAFRRQKQEEQEVKVL